MSYILPQLDFQYADLEPHIDALTIETHYSKHHEAYRLKLNNAVENYPELFEKSIEELLSDPNLISEDIRTAVINNGGGYYHHNIFWKMINPQGGGEPKGSLAEAIVQEFGSFDKFKELFYQEAVALFGSGWAWLVKTMVGKLEIVSTSNQDSPISKGQTPLMGIDVWEHAYYLNYQNRRSDYINIFWKIANWEYAENKFKV